MQKVRLKVHNCYQSSTLTFYQVAGAAGVGRLNTRTDIDPETSGGCQLMMVVGIVILC